jgi:predicted RNase H-like HicB family nuclease
MSWKKAGRDGGVYTAACILNDWRFDMSANTEQSVAVKLRVVFHRNEDGPGYWAEVPGFPGCLTEGDTLDEARANVRDAFAGILAALQNQGGSEHFPDDVTEEIDL